MLVYFRGKNNFDNNVVNCSLNVATFGMLIDIVDIEKSHDFSCYGNHFGGKL